MQNYSYIDIEQINLVSDGNKELVSDLISMFKTQAIVFASELDKLYSIKDFVALGKLAHKIKGSVSAIGITSLAVSMKELETIAKEGTKQDKYPILISEFKTVSQKAIHELDHFIKNY